MIDARVQIKGLLETVNSNVKPIYPEGDVSLPIITYSQVSNVTIGKWLDRIEFQVDAWSSTFSGAIELAKGIDAVMTGAGYTRTYESSDSMMREGKDLYHKVLNFVGNVDTHLLNILGG